MNPAKKRKIESPTELREYFRPLYIEIYRYLMMLYNESMNETRRNGLLCLSSTWIETQLSLQSYRKTLTDLSHFDETDPDRNTCFITCFNQLVQEILIL